MPASAETIRIKQGLDIPVMGAPQQRIEIANPVLSVGLLGHDYPGIKPKLMVEQDDRVKLGQTLFVSKTHPSLRITSPGCGVVTNIERGPGRILRSIEIKLDGDEEESFDAYRVDDPSSLEPEQIRDGLLASGLWTALRTRPYSRIPSPEQTPFALFVTAIDTNPLSATPGVIISQAAEAFRDGLSALSRLIDGSVYLCTASGDNVPVPDIANIDVVSFDGPHPAGLVGTHIHFLTPVSA